MKCTPIEPYISCIMFDHNLFTITLHWTACYQLTTDIQDRVPYSVCVCELRSLACRVQNAKSTIRFENDHGPILRSIFWESKPDSIWLHWRIPLHCVFLLTHLGPFPSVWSVWSRIYVILIDRKCAMEENVQGQFTKMTITALIDSHSFQNECKGFPFEEFP